MQRNQPTEVKHKPTYRYEDVWFVCSKLKNINLTLNLVQMRPEFTKRWSVCPFLNNLLLERKSKFECHLEKNIPREQTRASVNSSFQNSTEG